MKKVIQIWNDEELAIKLKNAGFKFLYEITSTGLESIYVFEWSPEIEMAMKEIL